MRRLSQEDLTFLKKLQETLCTQETDSQASPRFWGVLDTTRTFGVGEGYATGSVLTYYNELEGADIDVPSMEELIEIVNDLDVELKDSLLSELKKCDEDMCDAYEILQSYGLDNKFSQVFYWDEDVVVNDAFFFTKSACQAHIAKCQHNYNDPKTYAMTAHDNPQIATLLDILESVDWDSYEHERR